MNEYPIHTPASRRRAVWLGACLVVLASLWVPRSVLPCFSGCFIDLSGNGGIWNQLGMADVRLNAWILAWGTRVFGEGSGLIFDAPNFYPAKGALTGSEHLVALSIQALPLSWFTDSAAALYNFSLVGSFVTLGLAVYALVLWVTKLPSAAALAAVLAVTAPWRLASLAHLQVLSIGWLPVVWLLLLRRASGVTSLGNSAALMVVTTLQLLSCYYLAYMTTLSVAVLVAVLSLAPLATGAVGESGRRLSLRQRLRAVLVLVAPLVPAYLCLVAISLPYLMRSRGGGLAVEAWPTIIDSANRVWPLLGPPSLLPSLMNEPAASLSGSWFPPSLLALSAAALLGLWKRPGTAVATERTGAKIQVRLVAVLMLVGGVATLLAFGPADPGGAVGIHFLADLFRDLVPGYGLFRVSERWLALVSVALAVLAGVGAASLLRMARTAAGSRGVAAATTALTLLVLLYVPTLRLPTVPALGALEPSRQLYTELASLPDGAVLEVPWQRLPDEANYQLAQTLHWKPLLNGYTGYPPDSYTFLQHQARTLPAPESIELLRKLADLRWLVVHKGSLDARAWKAASQRGQLVKRGEDQAAVLYEVQPWPLSGSVSDDDHVRDWMRAERAPATTLGGATREPLLLSAADGELVVDSIHSLEGRDLFASLPVTVTLHNKTTRVWPAADFRRDGLIELAFEYRDVGTGGLVQKGRAAIWDDVPAQGSVRVSFLATPLYLLPQKPAELHLRVVQRVGNQLREVCLSPAITPLPRN